MKVIGKTTVNVSSLDHKAPYDVLLLQEASGKMLVKKADGDYEIGDEYGMEKPAEATKPLIGVVGTGVMGSGIALAFLNNGFKVVCKTRSAEGSEKIILTIKNSLSKTLGEEKASKIVGEKLIVTTNTSDLKDCEFVIESIVEEANEKEKLFKELDAACGGKAVICTNTSSLNVTKLSEGVSRKEKFVGMHFFNPADKMKLVEVVKTNKTSEETIQKIVSLANQLGKTAVVVKDSPGFVVNRLLMPFLNEAVIIYGNGVASAEEIDSAIRLGLNHPMGPLKLLDLIGLDVFVLIMNSLHEQTGEERFKPAPLALKMVSEGKLGIKTKQGFYNYSN